MIHKYIYFLREICSSWKGELTVRLWEWKGRETMVLHWWDITSLFGLINRLDDVNWPLLRVSKLTYCALKLWWKAPNISFRNYFLWPTYIIISVDQTKLSNYFVTYCSNFCWMYTADPCLVKFVIDSNQLVYFLNGYWNSEWQKLIIFLEYVIMFCCNFVLPLKWLVWRNEAAWRTPECTD